MTRAWAAEVARRGKCVKLRGGFVESRRGGALPGSTVLEARRSRHSHRARLVCPHSTPSTSRSQCRARSAAASWVHPLLRAHGERTHETLSICGCGGDSVVVLGSAACRGDDMEPQNEKPRGLSSAGSSNNSLESSDHVFEASQMLWMALSSAPLNSASLCWAVRPSLSAREKLAIMPFCRARRLLASSRL
jgi:hypothetical protein